MKKFLLLLLFLPTLSQAQHLFNKKDAFTGKEIKGAVIMMGLAIANSGQMLSFAVDNSNKYISYTWTSPSGTFGAFNEINLKETSIMLKLETDSIIIFKADTLLSKIINSGSSSILSISSPISNEQLKMLSEQTIKILRIGIKEEAGVDLDGLFTKKNKEQVKKAAAFMLN